MSTVILSRRVWSLGRSFYGDRRRASLALTILALSPAAGGAAPQAAAPYSRLFPRAVAVVHQGGIGTVGQALAVGRPMLVVPFSHDQPDNAARLVRLGVARTLVWDY